MPAELPYMMTVGNIPAILDRIREAGTPPKFTHEFLKNSLGFRGSGDRGIIKVLKHLGFITGDSTPTQRYNDFRSRTTGGLVLAQGLREGWSDVFLADQRAQDKSAGQLADLFKSVTGAGDASAKKMAQTFKALTAKADWTAAPSNMDTASDVEQNGSDTGGVPPPPPEVSESRGQLNLHHDIHIHLPATSDVAVYTAIFRALRDELHD